MKTRDMTGEYAIPKVEAGQASRTVESFMDDEAFAGFYERSARQLWAYVARVSGDSSLADDVTQESYLRFLCAANHGDGELEWKKYLFRIATNLLRDHWRRPVHSAIDQVPEAALARTAVPGPEQIASETLLDAALAQLRPRERQLLWLAHAEEYSHREIAEITGLGAASIRLLLFRARHKVARLLRNQANEIREGMK